MFGILAASTNISSKYSYSTTVAPTLTAGPWKVYECKKKSTEKVFSLFVFDKRTLDTHSNGLGRSSATALKRATEEVVERLRKEASSLARLRHPSILELVEPVEDTRGGGLQFVSEAVTGCLAGLLQEKDDKERAGRVRSSRHVTEDADGIENGLLQVSAGLEFMHENAGLVHCNLTPDAVLINAKGDWKLSGFAFCSPNSSKPTSFAPVNLSEMLNVDPRLPRSVQLNLDYTSPDLVLDNNLTPAADMFSLGLLCVSLYNSPHRSPLDCHSSVSTYKRLFQSSSTVPSASNDFLCTRPLPKELVYVLPRLMARRPVQRMTAREFQQSEFFNNTLVASLRFLDSFPTKTQSEKTQFLRGLAKLLPSFSKKVLEKKILVALMDELKHRELLGQILFVGFKIVDMLMLPRAFGELRVRLKELFVTNARPLHEKDAARDAGLTIVLENLSVMAENCNGKEFKDDVLPIFFCALESTTPSLIDAALRSLPIILPKLDFICIKNELFPVIAAVFSRTTSLAIKVRGLQAFVILCGGSLETPGLDDDDDADGLDGIVNHAKRKPSSSSALDKFTMQEKVTPLIKSIKTKEPAVMMAALSLLRVVGRDVDVEFVASELLPTLWRLSLGPLLNLHQFRAFMQVIKALSRRIEDEHVAQLQELGNGATAMPADDFMSFGPVVGSTSSVFDANGTTEDDFEKLVKGTSKAEASNPMDAWGELGASMGPNSPTRQPLPSSGSAATMAGKSTAPAFSWSTTTTTTTTPAANNRQFGPVQGSSFRTVTPDFTGGMLQPLTPSATQFSQPLQPTTNGIMSPMSSAATTTTTTPQPAPSSINWGPAAWPSSSTGSTFSPATNTFGSQQQATSLSLRPPPVGGSGSFSLAPPPGGARASTSSASSLAQRPAMTSPAATNSMNGMMGMAQMQAQAQQRQQQAQVQVQAQGSGLDKYASLM